MHRITLIAAVLAGAALVGVVAQLADAAPGVPALSTALGAPWLLAAFAAGALLRRPAVAALGGATLLCGGTLVYYLVRLVLGGGLRLPDQTAIPLAWAAAAAGAGAAMGALGAAWRAAGTGRYRIAGAFAAAVPPAATAGEALLLAGEWRGRIAMALLAAELALAAVLLPACARRRAPLPVAALAAAVLAVAFAAGEDELRGALRQAGWRGA